MEWGEESKKEIYIDLAKTFDNIYKLQYSSGEKVIYGKIPTELKGENRTTYLAPRILEHDLMYVAAVVKNESELLNTEEGYEINDFCFSENLRLGMNLIQYITSGDKRFLKKINVDHITMLSDNLAEYEDRTISTTDLTEIPNVLHFISTQLSKNSFKNIEDWNYCNNASYPIRIDVEFSQDEHNHILSVKDQGTGIDEIHLKYIFGNYTNGGTNVGLTASSFIVNSLGGHFEVITTTQDGKTYRYDTRVGEIIPKNNQLSRGTEFKVYMPK